MTICNIILCSLCPSWYFRNRSDLTTSPPPYFYSSFLPQFSGMTQWAYLNSFLSALWRFLNPLHIPCHAWIEYVKIIFSNLSFINLFRVTRQAPETKVPNWVEDRNNESPSPELSWETPKYFCSTKPLPLWTQRAKRFVHLLVIIQVVKWFLSFHEYCGLENIFARQYFREYLCEHFWNIFVSRNRN